MKRHGASPSTGRRWTTPPDARADEHVLARRTLGRDLEGQPPYESALAEPGWRAKTFDFAVANPPFSTKSWSNGLDPQHDKFGRFEMGVPPAKNRDYAFLLHIVNSLKSTGTGAVILPHGVLDRGHAEALIRRAAATPLVRPRSAILRSGRRYAARGLWCATSWR